MEKLVAGWIRFRSVEKAFRVAAVYSLLLFLLVLALQNGQAALQIFNFNHLPLSVVFLSFLATFFDPISAFTPMTLALSVASSAIGGITIGVFYAYFKIRKDAVKSGDLAIHGMLYFITLLAIQCIACGTVLLITFFSIIGGLWVLESLPLQGVEFGILALGVQCVLLYLLVKKLAEEQLVC